VDDESTAEKAGIKEGDIITSFDGTDVNTVEKLGELAKTAIDKGNFKVKITRDGKSQDIDVKIPKKLKTTNL
jgi:serine protease Do